MSTNGSNRLTRFFIDYFKMSSQLVPQPEAEQAIRDDVSFRGTNIVILVLAILIASLGLNTNSTAVIIGAMLISPLMGPIIGIGLGVGVHDFELIKRALRNLIMAAGFSVVASTLYFMISPVGEGHSELLARTSPTIYDVLIGFVGGGAGILAIGSRSKGNVIPGVAIATALMPPLCTAGYGLATWQLSYFFGAFYLFVINSIYIAFATFIGVKLMGYKGVSVVDNRRARRVRRIVYTLALLTMLPSIWLTVNMFRQNNFEMMASDFIQSECQFADAQVISDKAYISGGHKYISLTLIGRPMPLDSLQEALSSRLAAYGLEGARLKIVQGGLTSAPDNNSAAAVREDELNKIYQTAQSTIEQQQMDIDSLRAVISASLNDAGRQLAPEMKVVFPEVAELSVGRTLMTTMATDQTDTLTVAMVSSPGALGAETRRRLKEYLEARLKINDITIIQIPSIKKDDTTETPRSQR